MAMERTFGRPVRTSAGEDVGAPERSHAARGEGTLALENGVKFSKTLNTG